jgi:hypothetical protein
MNGEVVSVVELIELTRRLIHVKRVELGTNCTELCHFWSFVAELTRYRIARSFRIVRNSVAYPVRISTLAAAAALRERQSLIYLPPTLALTVLLWK